MCKVKCLIDIDGTIADSSARLSAIKTPKNHSRNTLSYLDWLNKVQKEHKMIQDKPLKNMHSLVSQLKDFVYLTSRDEKYRKVTETWLKLHKFPNRKLIMRPSGDMSSYGVFKEKEAKKYAKKGYQIVMVDDDPRGQLARICRKNSWILLKVISHMRLP